MTQHKLPSANPVRFTNGMVERFNGRIGKEVLVMCIGIHRDLERLLHAYNLAYNARRQRVLEGRSPEEVQERLKANLSLANAAFRPPNLCHVTKVKTAAQVTLYYTKDVSPSDN